MQILLNIFIIDLDDGRESALLFVSDSKMGGKASQPIYWAIHTDSIQKELSYPDCKVPGEVW